MRSTAARSSLACLALALVPGLAAGDELRTRDGTHDEAVQAIEEEAGQLVVRTAQRVVPLELVTSIHFRAVTAPSLEPDRARVRLVTGDVLHGALVDGDDDEALVLRTDGPSELRIPLDLVRAVAFGPTVDRPAPTPAPAPTALGHEAVDVVRLRDGATARGSITRIGGAAIVLESDLAGGSRVGRLSLPLAKVELVTLAPLEPPPAPAAGPAVVTARLVDGATLTGHLLGLADGALRLVHPLGALERLPSGVERRVLTIPVARLAELVRP